MGLDNLLTFGGANKLENEKQEFWQLAREYSSIEEEYKFICAQRKVIINLLNQERYEADRNFVLMASLISTIKTIIREESMSISDDLVSVVSLENFDSSISNLKKFNTNLFEKSYSETVKVGQGSLNRLHSSYVKNGSVSKAQLKGELAVVGAVAVANTLGYIGDLNEKVNQERKDLVERRKVMQENYKAIIENFEDIYKEILRAKELVTVLNKNNNVFMSIYLNFLQDYFIDSDLNKFKNGLSKEDLKDIGFFDSLKKMINICESYSDVSRLSITKENV